MQFSEWEIPFSKYPTLNGMKNFSDKKNDFYLVFIKQLFGFELITSNNFSWCISVSSNQ